MSIDTLKSQIPDYAKDLKLNLSNILSSTALNERQIWGAVLASALAAGNPKVIAAIAEDAAQHLTEQDAKAAKSAAAIMAMNNVYYRSLHLLSNPEYGKMPARLRMNVIANPGAEKLDFELWSLSVSAINGCGMCLEAHEREVLGKGASKEAVQDALRIAAVVHAVSATLTGEDALPESQQAAA
ncbi:carboxymuconolactone decarboxylase family protein [Fodinicurvata halophila]|uniref:Alkyl hydroperoxide reductase AhpD n=1 Tax=Fodinicurvata halophila TaxID=1419723 RepID=A0ABV8UMG3_9PROT